MKSGVVRSKRQALSRARASPLISPTSRLRVNKELHATWQEVLIEVFFGESESAALGTPF